MTRVLALADHSKIGCITQRRFAKVGTKTHPQRGAALDRNGLSVSTETACRFEPKSPVGNSEICIQTLERLTSPGRGGSSAPQCRADGRSWARRQVGDQGYRSCRARPLAFDVTVFSKPGPVAARLFGGAGGGPLAGVLAYVAGSDPSSRGRGGIAN